ncbi:MAG: hypothetical protein HZA88_15220 [Verrucomicrobia bacterium]|nr:hypothetical protein [Verrucomicrobiota bacterium]
MITIICKGYKACHKADGIILEIEEPTPVDLVPRLIKRADAAARLAVSPRHFDSLVAKAGIRPVEGLPVRYRESDLLTLTLSAAERIPLSRVIVPLPAPQPKPAVAAPSPPTATTAAAPAQARPKTKLRI